MRASAPACGSPRDRGGPAAAAAAIVPLILSLALAPATAQAGQAPSVSRLDHVVIVTRNLDSASAEFTARGFRLKSGRLHPDNLLNRHIKFRDGTEIELMTLAGPALDANARDYAELLSQGTGPVYVALRVPDLAPIVRAAGRLGLRFRRSESGSWKFLSFPGRSDASAVFFLSGGNVPADPDSIVAHPNGAAGLRDVWVEGGTRLEALLRAGGASRADSMTLPDGRQGRRWQLASGALVICSTLQSPGRPRPLGITLLAPGETNGPRSIRLPDGTWLTLAPASPAN